MIPFPLTSRAALDLKKTPQEVARLTRPEREDRVRKLIGYGHWMIQRSLEKHLDGRKLAAKVIMFSGGNDSTVLADIFRHSADYAMHANTGIGIEQTRKFVRDTCGSWNLPLVEKSPKPGDTYRDMILTHGFPGPGQHYKMYQRLKERCIEQTRSELVGDPRKERILFIGGRRRSESARRSDVSASNRKGSMFFTAPLVLWTKLDLNTYRLIAENVPVNEVSELIHMSGECLCGSFAEKEELEMIGFFFPGMREEIEQLEDLIRDREDIPAERRKWGWGAYRSDLETLKRRGHFRSGSMCTSCAGRATGGEILTTTS